MKACFSVLKFVVEAKVLCMPQFAIRKDCVQGVTLLCGTVGEFTQLIPFANDRFPCTECRYPGPRVLGHSFLVPEGSPNIKSKSAFGKNFLYIARGPQNHNTVHETQNVLL